MAQKSVPIASTTRRRRTTGRTGWWHNVSEKVIVAGATALVTGFITILGPPLNDWAFSKINNTDGVTSGEVGFQQTKWLQNSECANSQPVWHETADGHKIDATICPGTGDILLVMKNRNGRQTQWWSDNRNLTDRLSGNAEVAALLSSLVSTPAHASPVPGAQAGPRLLAQSVLCQIMLDNRGLRRRIVVGPDRCIEIIIDTWTGTVVSQRPVPCVPNCAVNA